jgi:hypothetical protein
MEQVQAQLLHGLNNKGVATWNEQQWQLFMELTKAVQTQVTRKADDKNKRKTCTINEEKS